MHLQILQSHPRSLARSIACSLGERASLVFTVLSIVILTSKVGLSTADQCAPCTIRLRMRASSAASQWRVTGEEMAGVAAEHIVSSAIPRTIAIELRDAHCHKPALVTSELSAGATRTGRRGPILCFGLYFYFCGSPPNEHKTLFASPPYL